MTVDVRTRLGRRFEHKRELGVPIRSRCGTASKENDIQSGFAEIFACEQLGCEPNLEITDGGDNGIDGIYQGHTFDVKWLGMFNGFPRSEGRILVDLGKLRADMYIAVSGCERTGFTCVGWCTAEDLLEAELFTVPYPDVKGRFKRYAMHTDYLRPMSELIGGE